MAALPWPRKKKKGESGGDGGSMHRRISGQRKLKNYPRKYEKMGKEKRRPQVNVFPGGCGEKEKKRGGGAAHPNQEEKKVKVQSTVLEP